MALPGIWWRPLNARAGLPAIPERGRTFDANAIAKARAVAKATGHLALADDSGIEVEALGWRPGVQSARFAGTHGDDRANNDKLLRLLQGLPPSRRRARYRCALALAAPSRLIAVTRGTWAGRIALAPAGGRGFGYDPIVVIPRLGRTVAQLPRAAKHRLSHRAQAARRMRAVMRRLLRRPVTAAAV